MENSKNNSKRIIAVVIIVILAIGIWYVAARKSDRTLVTTQPVITLQSPNGRETFTIGDRIPVTFDAGDVQADQWVVMSLESGAAPLALVTATTTQVLLELPESILIGGDALAPLEPGKYKLRLTLYQGRPCLGHCIATSSTELGFDLTDSEFTIVKAATPTATSTGAMASSTTPVASSTTPVATSTATTTRK